MRDYWRCLHDRQLSRMSAHGLSDHGFLFWLIVRTFLFGYDEYSGTSIDSLIIFLLKYEFNLIFNFNQFYN